MDIQFAEEDLAFREEVRGFFQEKLPADLKRKTLNGEALSRDEIMRWHRILHERGWVAPNWPKEYGGPGWSVTEKYIFDEEHGPGCGAPPDPVRARHVRAGADGVRHAGAEGLPPAAHALRRACLGPGLFRSRAPAPILRA